MNSKNYEAPKGFIKIYQILMKFPLLQNIRVIFYFLDFLILLSVPKAKYCEKDKKKVLVVFPYALGDCILFCGVAKYFRELYPSSEYELSIICQSANSSIFERYFDMVLPFNFTKSSVNISYRRIMYKELRKKYYDVVVDPITCTFCTPNVFATHATLAKTKIGFIEESDKKAQCPRWMRNRIYTELHTVKEKNLHRIKYYAEELRLLGIKDCVATPAEFEGIDISIDLPQHFYVIFPTASLPVKMWPVERFAQIAKRIYQKKKIPLVLCGTEHDRKTTEQLQKMLPDIPIINLLGKTSILEFIELIGRADFILTNDTSTYHIAMAKKVKTFLICGGYVFDTFANYQYEKYGYPTPILIYHQQECFNCDNFCKYNVNITYPCVSCISVEDVWEKVKKSIS